VVESGEVLELGHGRRQHGRVGVDEDGGSRDGTGPLTHLGGAAHKNPSAALTCSLRFF
jgi:hypothetical protein